MFKDKIGNKYERMMSYRKWAIMTSSSHLLLISSQLFSCTANEDLGGQNVLLCRAVATGTVGTVSTRPLFEATTTFLPI